MTEDKPRTIIRVEIIRLRPRSEANRCRLVECWLLAAFEFPYGYWSRLWIDTPGLSTQVGGYSPKQLERMNQEFTAAVEHAFGWEAKARSDADAAA